MPEQLISKFLRTQAFSSPWHISGSQESTFEGAIVIPSLAESKNLFATLASLANNPPDLQARFLILVVVNQRLDAGDADKNDNFETLRKLAAESIKYPDLRLSWIDAASPGLELPTKGGGVGMARKIGHDLALARLAPSCRDPLLVSLDADTLVEPSYLSAILHHFRAQPAGGAIIPFSHQLGRTREEAHAIDRYELFLRSYVLGLKLAGSPYAFHTVGSAMACRASAYCRMGGMNKRSAGEDFYFLQQLFRTSGIAQVSGTEIHPSPRASHRVPFGTGRSVGRMLDGDVTAVLFYRHECFELLARWLALVRDFENESGMAILAQAGRISSALAQYLDTIGFVATWDRLKQHHPTIQALRKAFHDWFDALKTMKLIHHFSAMLFPRCDPAEAIPPLLHWGKMPPLPTSEGQLQFLRKTQNQEQPTAISRLITGLPAQLSQFPGHLP